MSKIDRINTDAALLKKNHFSSDMNEYVLELCIDKTKLHVRIDKKQFDSLKSFIPAYSHTTTPEKVEVKKID